VTIIASTTTSGEKEEAIASKKEAEMEAIRRFPCQSKLSAVMIPKLSHVLTNSISKMKRRKQFALSSSWRGKLRSHRG